MWKASATGIRRFWTEKRNKTRQGAKTRPGASHGGGIRPGFFCLFCGQAVRFSVQLVKRVVFAGEGNHNACEAQHADELDKSGPLTVNLDAAQRGVGGDMPAIALTKRQYQLHKGVPYTLNLLLRGE